MKRCRPMLIKIQFDDYRNIFQKLSPLYMKIEKRGKSVTQCVKFCMRVALTVA